MLTTTTKLLINLCAFIYVNIIIILVIQFILQNYYVIKIHYYNNVHNVRKYIHCTLENVYGKPEDILQCIMPRHCQSSDGNAL